MKLFCVVALWITGLLAGLSLLALPLWLLGVPGVENSYAKGWRIGLFTVLIYPVVWGDIFAIWRMARNQMGAEHEATLNLWIGSGSVALLAAGLCVLVYAFRVMSRT